MIDFENYYELVRASHDEPAALMRIYFILVGQKFLFDFYFAAEGKGGIQHARACSPRARGRPRHPAPARRVSIHPIPFSFSVTPPSNYA